MRRSLLARLVAFTMAVAAAHAASDNFYVKPFEINLSAEIPRLKSLVNNSRLPDKDLYPSFGPEKGIKLDVLRELRADWLTNFDWEVQQAELNQLKQFTAVIEGLTVHFVHERSTDPDAIPVILLHGWPGSFFEFAPIIKPLTQGTSTTGKNISFNVVAPSLPGFLFSSAPPANWTINDTARIFDTLMTKVLGYSTYALHGTDWGCAVGYSLYSSFNATVRTAHFAFLPFPAPSPQDIAENNISLSPIQQVTEQRGVEFNAIGTGYLIEQTTKPNDIGLALHDSPMGQLAWLGGIFKLWSDPRAGTPPSVLNNTAILTVASLYFLTDSLLSAAKAATDAPLLFSQYEYNVALWPEEYVAKNTAAALAMLQSKEFSAWVSIEGQEVPEYDVEISDDKKTITCWIASELGKKFSVHWKNSSYRETTLGTIKMDGNSCGGKYIYAQNLPVTAVKEGVSDGTTMRAFMFSSLALTDDDSYLGGNPHPDLGLIELLIYPVRTLPHTRVVVGSATTALSTLKVHERSKKAVTQQIALGESQKLERRHDFVSAQRTGPDLVKFLFKYRPLDILRANGIAPQSSELKRKAEPAQGQRSQEDVKRVKKENKPIVKHTENDAKKSRVKHEADDDIIDLTEDAPRGKRVKLEGFVQGQVIDLT
ncbi:Alpha/Beta hydrolase protein [Mycena polygramma]|nr:Alpha/Beta hydrolase protein [Mycena polygramma]